MVIASYNSLTPGFARKDVLLSTFNCQEVLQKRCKYVLLRDICIFLCHLTEAMTMGVMLDSEVLVCVQSLTQFALTVPLSTQAHN